VRRFRLTTSLPLPARTAFARVLDLDEAAPLPLEAADIKTIAETSHLPGVAWVPGAPPRAACIRQPRASLVPQAHDSAGRYFDLALHRGAGLH
jgi:hypothetical protein